MPPAHKKKKLNGIQHIKILWYKQYIFTEIIY